jgi:hypothetical protein
MLETIMDYSIFEHFTQNQPAPIPLGSAEENDRWLSFWNYLKSGCDLVLTNFQDKENLFLNNLTTGRKGTKIFTEVKFKKPYKCKFPKEQTPQTVLFIDEPLETEQKKYCKNNGLLFGFKNNYPETWENLSLHGKPKVLPVRNSTRQHFKSWNQLSEYILPFSDLIIVDNYMFDETVWDYNLFQIIKKFAEKATVKFNLLLVSFANREKLMAYKGIEQRIKKKLDDLHISCNLSIVLAKQSFKEHDRGIFTNYLRIKSGDSFVYFDKNGKFLTSGTDIDFHSLSEPDKFNASEAALSKIKEIIQHLETNNEKEKRLFGDLKNRLLENES